MRIYLAIFCLSGFLVSGAQTKWYPYAGLHGSMDAEGFYVGPSFQVGTDYAVRKKLALTAYLHYFPKSVKGYYEGGYEQGRFRCLTLAVMAQKRVFNKGERGWFVAGGMAFQHAKDDYVYDDPYNNDDWEDHSNRFLVTGAFRFGYNFPLKNMAMAFEINGTGPYISKVGPAPYYNQSIEILTQLSLGFRIMPYKISNPFKKKY